MYLRLICEKKNYKNLVGVAYKQVLSVDRSLRYIRLGEERFVLFSLEKHKLNLREVSLSYSYPRLETKIMLKFSFQVACYFLFY